MYYSRREETKPILTLKHRCEKCGEVAKFLLQKREASGCIWIIPYWGGKDYFVTCGNCFTTFKIDRKTGEILEKGSSQIQKQVKDKYGGEYNVEFDFSALSQDKKIDDKQSNLNH